MDKFDSLETFIGQLTGSGPADPGQLLQYLYEIQYRYSCIPARAVEQLAVRLDMPPARITGVIDYYSFLHTTPRGEFDILFSDNITDHMLGSRELLQRLCERLGVGKGIPRGDGRVTIDTTSCTGICDQGPAMLVNGWTVARLDAARIDTIAGLVEAATPVADWPAEFFQVTDNIQRRDRLLTDTISEGAALQALSLQGADRLLDDLERSGLRGRGGAGFRTATKWRLCRAAEATERYVVCNADEGEPGTFKDRILLGSYADQMFEGMTLCAGIVGARQGYLYLRGEYRYLREPLEAVLARRREAGLLGAAIQGRAGFDFDIEIHMGAGAYICGEESALLESLEGKRGIARVRPPFPVTHGFRGQPTVVNNVETFMKASAIAVHGAAWMTATGTAESTGTKLLSISGDCERPGIYEYPFGVSIRQVLQDCGAVDVQAVQVAGAAGTTIAAAEFDRVLAFEDVSTGGSFMVFNAARDMLDMVCNFAHFFAHESCGFCTPCRVGGVLLRDLVDKVCAGRASEFDLQEMRGIGKLMRQTSQCGLGTTAPNHVLNTLDKFPDSYRRR
ncbi:MAG TPA: NAD(P)H-dependent oxidoreductase subunit E, partial [Gammaproteobacteria bacterium]|nr:NAD(P)H-dependent oxidoreductase subunit E [Gammaproteobacteria bacterium]